MMFWILTAVAEAALAAGLVALLALSRHHRRLQEALPATPERNESGGDCPGWARWVIDNTGTAWQALAGTAAVARTELLLTQAGRPWGLTAEAFLALRFAAAVLATLLSLALVLVLPLWWAILPVPIGYFVPDWVLKRVSSRRQAAVECDLPDLLDLIVQALDAGSSLENAVASAGSAMRGEVATEVERLVQEFRLNTPRLVAFSRLAERNPHVRDLRYLVVALREGYRLGTPVAATLQQYAREIRRQRGTRAKELAAKAKPKIMMIGLLGVAPVAILFIAGLIWLNYMYNPAFASLRQGL